MFKDSKNRIDFHRFCEVLEFFQEKQINEQEGVNLLFRDFMFN